MHLLTTKIMSKNNPGIHMPMPQAKMKPLTEEEKKIKIMQFLQQKREQFSINILCSMVQGAVQCEVLQRSVPKALVDTSVEMADKLLEKLYPIKEEESK